MASTNRNPWLDAHASDDEDAANEDQSYDSEAAEERRPTHRASKRRRHSIESEVSEYGTSNASSEDDSATAPRKARRLNESSPFQDDDAAPKLDSSNLDTHDDPRLNTQRFTSASTPAITDSSNPPAASTNPPSHRKLGPPLLTPTTSARPPKSKQKPGILYISRIPPFMKPSTLRSLLTPHAPKHGLHRLFLTPEPSASHTLRTKSGGNKKRSYTDGWVEFFSKREAKHACDLLNCQQIGGKKSGYYHDDVWNLRYLRGFRWERDLVGVVAGEGRERGARVEEGARVQRREDKRFVGAVERERERRGMERRRAEKLEARAEMGEGGVSRELKQSGAVKEPEQGGASKETKQDQKRTRFTTHFRQNKVLLKDAEANRGPVEDVQRVLSKIF